jgi:hypothetical protein
MNTKTLIITILFLAIGTAAFLFAGGIEKERRMSGALYEDLQVKTAYTPEGLPLLFVLADERDLAAYPAAEGTNIPAPGTIVLGALDAQMMVDAGMIAGVGDTVEDFFGLDATIGGFLAPQQAPVDDMHFVAAEDYPAVTGEEGRVFFEELDGMPKVFYARAIGESTPLTLPYAEGDAALYAVREFEGKPYAPVVIGSAEAAMMREEGLFTQVGDRIDGFFGQDVVIAGVLEKTGTALDMMHVLPFTADELAG